MRKHFKQAAAGFLAFLLTVTILPAEGLQAAEGTQDVWQEFPAQETQADDFEQMLEEYNNLNGHREVEGAYVPVSLSEYQNYIPKNYGTLASKYDPREDSEMKNYISIRNQGSFGTCWAHGAMAAVEMDASKNYSQESENYSEFQLAYFMAHERQDPLGLISDDRVLHESSADSGYWDGGNEIFTSQVLMSWVGAVSEEDYPDTAYEVLKTQKEAAVLENQYAFECDEIHVQDFSWINTADEDVMKEMILKHGALAVSYHTGNYFASDQVSYYNYQDKGTTNHEVVIIGWDDDYDKNKFAVTPLRNGAWLIKNSWGSYMNDNGCFWMSYDDVSLDDQAIAYTVVPSTSADGYKYNYQYDGGVYTGATAYSQKKILEANVFEAQGNEILKAASFYCNENYAYQVQVVKDLTDRSDPASGTVVAQASGTQLFAGYHTVTLDQNVSLAEGDVFAVIVELQNKNGNETQSFVDFPVPEGGWMASVTSAKEGQSFVKTETALKWTDISKNNYNVRIKAYTIDNVTNPISSITLKSGSSFTIKNGETLQLAEQLSVLPAGTDDQLCYEIDREAIAEITSDGCLTAKRPGTVLVTAKARAGAAKLVIPVTIEPNVPAEAIRLSDVRVTVGRSKMLTAVLTPADSDDEPCFTVEDDTIARITEDGNITGVSEGTTTVTAVTSKGLTAKCQVLVSKRSEDTISCAWDKIPGKVYKYNAISASVPEKIKKLNPVKIEWTASSANVQLTPMGTDGTEGVSLYVSNALTTSRRGEKVILKATVTYTVKPKKEGKPLIVKKKVYKKRISLYNLSYQVALNRAGIVSVTKGEKINLSAILNEGNASDQPTNPSLKWAITDAFGKKDKTGKRVATVNSKGIVVTKGPGTTYVSVYAADSYDKASKTYQVSATIPITCTPVTTIGFSAATVKAQNQQTVDLKSMLVFNGGRNTPFNQEKMKLSWKSSNSRAVSVNSKGVVRIGKKASGSYTITVRAVGGVKKGQPIPEGSITIEV